MVRILFSIADTIVDVNFFLILGEFVWRVVESIGHYWHRLS